MNDLLFLAVALGVKLLLVATVVWPADAAKYSHYVRPAVATENEAKETAVALSTQNAPMIEYQDPLDRRAFIPTAAMLAGDFAPFFPLKHMKKDLELMLKAADAVDIELPATVTVASLYDRAVRRGLGERDYSAILQMIGSDDV